MSEIVVILGPTAVGKSELGVTLAEELAGEIISADALQIYRGFDIGTAKISLRDARVVPHHLIDILEPHQRFSAGEFARRARACIEEIRARARLPIVLGGSGLYLRALLEGISPIPPIAAEVHEHLRSRLEIDGLDVLRQQLQYLDPSTADRLLPGDSQRTLRALEVVISTGKPLSTWIAENPGGQERLTVTKIGLTLPRALLYDRIAERVHRMIQAGWVEEVEELLGRGLSPELPAFQAIGYRQLAAHLCGESSLEEAASATVRASCRYAKRQLTWFRREPEVTWFSSQDPQLCLREVRTFLDQSGLGEENGQG